MSRTSSTPDLKGFVDAVAPRVESAFHTVAEKAPPAFEKGRAVAAEHGAHAAEAFGNRLPESVVGRLPDSVIDHLSIKRPRRGRKLLLVGGLAVLAGAAVLVAKRAQGSGGVRVAAPVERVSPPRPATVDSVPPTQAPAEPESATDPADPLGIRP